MDNMELLATCNGFELVRESDTFYAFFSRPERRPCVIPVSQSGTIHEVLEHLRRWAAIDAENPSMLEMENTFISVLLELPAAERS